MRLDEAGLEQRKKVMLSLLDRIGEASLRDSGRQDVIRVLDAQTNVPADSVSPNAYFKYQEIYDRRGAYWELVEYYYEFQHRPGPGRRAHHLHPPIGWHQHCVNQNAAVRDDHYVGSNMSLHDAHREFLYWYAMGDSINCTDLTPLFS